MQKLQVTFYLFLFFYSCCAQNRILGKIIDAQTKAPLFGATVKYENVYVISNSKGEFTLKNVKAKGNELVINFTGYDNKKITLNAGLNVVIDMKVRIDTLTEVIVSSGAEKIIRKAIEKIKINYPQNNFIEEGIIRMILEYQEINPTAYQFYKIDAAVDLHYSSYKASSNGIDLSLVENRIQKFESEKKTKDEIRWEYAYSDLQNADIVYNRSEFIDKGELHKYKFNLIGKTTFRGRRMFEIQVNKKNNNILGTLLIDTATYAFVNIKYTKYNINTLFRRLIKEQNNNITYKCVDDKWYLDEIEINNQFKHKYINTNTFSSSKTFKAVSIIKSDATHNNAIKIESGGIDVLALQKTNNDSSWLKYDSIFKQNEHVGLFPLGKFSVDSFYVRNNIPQEKHTFFTYIGKYFNSNKFNFSISVSKLPIEFSGIQNNINKVIPKLSEYTFDVGLLFKLNRLISFEIYNSTNLGIGGLTASRMSFVFSSHFIADKKYIIEPSVSLSRTSVRYKSISQQTTINDFGIGIRVLPNTKKHIVPFISFSYLDQISMQNSMIQVTTLNFLPSLGIILKH